MNAFDVYREYVAIKLHFNSDKYDYVKFKGKNTASINSFNNRPDKYFFKKLSEELQSRDIIPFFIAQFIQCNTTWVGEMLDNFNESMSIYRKWKGARKSIKENVRSDISNIVNFLSDRNMKIENIFKVTDGCTHPIILRFYLEEMITIETMIYLNVVYKYIEDIKQELYDPVSEHHILIIEKYSSFLKIRKDLVDINSIINT